MVTMKSVDWILVPVNPDIPEKNHLVSNVYYPACRWLLVYNPKDERQTKHYNDIQEILKNASIEVESLEADVNNYYEILLKFDEWLQAKITDKNTTFAINGATNSIPAMNAIRDTLARRGHSGFVFSFVGKEDSIGGVPRISPLSTSSLTDEHLEIIRVLLNRGGKVEGQKELLKQLIEAQRNVDEKKLGKGIFGKYEKDPNVGKKVLSYYLQQLERLNIVRMVYEKGKRQSTIILNIFF